jgi:hypothetical protein
VVVGDFNPSPIDSLSKQKISKQILEINDTISQIALTDIYRIFLPTTPNINSSQQPMECSPK